MSILTENYIVKNVRAYPVLREKFMAYMKGVKNLPEGFRENKAVSRLSESQKK